MPYVYPPPPTTLYQPPPATQMYSQPPPVTQVYAQPPPPAQAYNQAQPVATQEEDKENKVSNITKKFGGQVATAATWGFGATCMSNYLFIVSSHTLSIFSGKPSCKCHFLEIKKNHLHIKIPFQIFKLST